MMSACPISSRGLPAELAAGAARMSGPIGNRLKRMPDKGWHRRFEDPVDLPRGPPARHVPGRADYILKLPKAEQNLQEWQTATEVLIMAAEARGPLMHARIGVMRAL